MKAESIVFAIAGMCFGVILGWVIGSQQATARPGATVAATEAAPAAQSAAAAGGGARQTPVLDEAKVQGLMTIINSDPKNAGALIQLGNTYFDAEKYPDAIKWYEQGVKLDARNVDASTDLGVSYYYSKRADEALTQFEHSLSIDPKHTKTLLNKGIVLAFGKQDMKGAAEAWTRVVEIAPNSPEGEAAKRGLEGIAAAHPGGTAGAPAASGS